jgi:hypothetical protein
VDGLQAKRFDKERECKFGQMAPCMRVGGRTTRQMAKEDSFIWMETPTMASGIMIKLMGLECFITLMELSITEIGTTISNTEMGWRLGLTEQNMKVIIVMVKNKELENLNGKMAVLTLENLLRMKSMEKVRTAGLTEENMKAIGWPTKCMAKASLNGLMVECTKETTLRIKSKAKECLHGLMVKNTMEAGKMESIMELLLSPRKLGNRRKENGKMERDLIGLMIIDYKI